MSRLRLADAAELFVITFSLPNRLGPTVRRGKKKFSIGGRPSTSQLHHLQRGEKPRLMARRPCVGSSPSGALTNDQTAQCPRSWTFEETVRFAPSF
jgi:hypothetical protein